VVAGVVASRRGGGGAGVGGLGGGTQARSLEAGVGKRVPDGTPPAAGQRTRPEWSRCPPPTPTPPPHARLRTDDVECRDRVEVFATEKMLREWPAFEALAKSFAEGEVCLRVAGLTGAARALAVAELLQTHPRPALVVVAGMADAHRWTQDLKLFGTPALEFSSPEPRLWRGGHHREADAERAMIARRLTVAEPITVVATPAALG